MSYSVSVPANNAVSALLTHFMGGPSPNGATQAVPMSAPPSYSMCSPVIHTIGNPMQPATPLSVPGASISHVVCSSTPSPSTQPPCGPAAALPSQPLNAAVAHGLCSPAASPAPRAADRSGTPTVLQVGSASASHPLCSPAPRPVGPPASHSLCSPAPRPVGPPAAHSLCSPPAASLVAVGARPASSPAAQPLDSSAAACSPSPRPLAGPTARSLCATTSRSLSQLVGTSGSRSLCGSQWGPSYETTTRFGSAWAPTSRSLWSPEGRLGYSSTRATYGTLTRPPYSSLNRSSYTLSRPGYATLPRSTSPSPYASLTRSGSCPSGSTLALAGSRRPWSPTRSTLSYFKRRYL